MNLRLCLGILVALFGDAAFAKCESNGLLLFPAPGGVLPTNTRFILEGVGREQTRVVALAGKRLVLKSNDDEVLVRVQPGWVSSQKRAAVKLIPARPLKPRRTYTLEWERALPRARLLNGAPGSGEATWLTGKGEDLSLPTWSDLPTAVEGRYDKDGDAVTQVVKLRSPLVDDAPAYLVVEMRRLPRGRDVQAYFVPVSGGQAELGHDACGGSFSFETGASYRAVLEARDAADNAAENRLAVTLSAPAVPKSK
ncbi:MAG: hypothetical protein ACKVPX_10270 [Myxococcaceae bacterium]